MKIADIRADVAQMMERNPGWRDFGTDFLRILDNMERDRARIAALTAERDAAVRIAEQRAAQMEQLDSLILWQGKTIERRAGVVRAAVEWKAALDASRSVGFGPIGCEDDPVWQREQAEHVRIAGERHERFHLAYIALEEAVDALAEPPAISLDEGWGDDRGMTEQQMEDLNNARPGTLPWERT